jgi:hypothetical protein
LENFPQALILATFKVVVLHVSGSTAVLCVFTNMAILYHVMLFLATEIILRLHGIPNASPE